MRYPGLSGDVVGTLDKQTLRNKTLILTDTVTGKKYKIIIENGLIGIEEI
jgi:hypothetical protein